MLLKTLIILVSTSISCLIVAMALDYQSNPFGVFKIAHIVILFGMIVSTPAMIFSYLQGSLLWSEGIRKIGPYLWLAFTSALINGAVLCCIMGAPFMKQDAALVSFMFLAAFCAGGVMTAAMVFCAMVLLEKYEAEKKVK